MRTFLMMKIYAVIAFALFGIRLAFYYLTLPELIQFLGSALLVSLAATGLHKYFEHKAHTTGKNAAQNPSFLVQMIVITILASGGIYMLISYLSTGELSVGFDVVYYVVFAPAAVLFGIWMYFQIIEQEYNHRLNQLKEKE